jgi:hypothetical protein
MSVSSSKAYRWGRQLDCCRIPVKNGALSVRDEILTWHLGE